MLGPNPSGKGSGSFGLFQQSLLNILALRVMAGLVDSIKGFVAALLVQLKVLYHMLLSPVRGDTHQDRLESFYKHQATGYDAFRKKMLHGREYIAQETPKFNKGIWVDMGGGTGA